MKPPDTFADSTTQLLIVHTLQLAASGQGRGGMGTNGKEGCFHVGSRLGSSICRTGLACKSRGALEQEALSLGHARGIGFAIDRFTMHLHAEGVDFDGGAPELVGAFALRAREKLRKCLEVGEEFAWVEFGVSVEGVLKCVVNRVA